MRKEENLVIVFPGSKIRAKFIAVSRKRITVL